MYHDRAKVGKKDRKEKRKRGETEGKKEAKKTYGQRNEKIKKMK
jgi:hypothetical protein